MRIAVFAAVALLAGCVSSPVKPLGDGLYTVTAQNYLGMSSGSHETVRAADKADAYCRANNQGALVKSHADGGVPAVTVLSGTVVFRCVSTADPAYLRQRADATTIP